MNREIARQLLLLLWVSLVASSFWVSETIVSYAGPIASTGLRFMLACLLTLPFIYQQISGVISGKILVQYGLISLFLVLFFIGMFEALKTTTALNTSVMYTLVPLMSVLLSFLWLKIRTSAFKLVGFVSGSCGAVWVLMVNQQVGLADLHWHTGDAIFFLSCISMALHVVLVKRWGSEVPASAGAFLILLTGSIILLPMVLVSGELEQVAWQEGPFWQALLYLTLFTTLATSLLQQYLVRQVGPNRLLAFTYLIPTLVALSQGLLSSSQFWSAQPGIILTLVALYLISSQQWQTPKDAS